MLAKLRFYRWVLLLIVVGIAVGAFCGCNVKKPSSGDGAPCTVITLKVKTVMPDRPASVDPYWTGDIAKHLSAFEDLNAVVINPETVEIRIPIKDGSPVFGNRVVDPQSVEEVIDNVKLAGALRFYMLPDTRPASSAATQGEASAPNELTMPVSLLGRRPGHGTTIRGAIDGRVRLSDRYVELGYDQVLIERAKVGRAQNGKTMVVLRCFRDEFRAVAPKLKEWDGRDVALVYEGTVYAYPLKLWVFEDREPSPYTADADLLGLSGVNSYDDCMGLETLFAEQIGHGRVVFPISVTTRPALSKGTGSSGSVDTMPNR